eukprot:1361364-Amphidinium_carterae.1
MALSCNTTFSRHRPCIRYASKLVSNFCMVSRSAYKFLSTLSSSAFAVTTSSSVAAHVFCQLCKGICIISADSREIEHNLTRMVQRSGVVSLNASSQVAKAKISKKLQADS